MQAYRIKNWDANYENAESRKIKNPKWIPVPIDFSGDGYTLIMEEKDGVFIYGCWIAFLAVGMSSGRDGILSRQGGSIPHDAISLSRKIRIPAKQIQRAFDFLINPVKWIDIIDFDIKNPISGNYPDASGKNPGGIEQNRIEQNRTEGKERDKSQSLPVSLFIESWNKLGSPFSKIQIFSLERKRHLNNRLKDSLWCDKYQTALEKIKESDFCKGKNDRSWKASVDWFLRPDTVAKILEGNYNNKNTRPSGKFNFVKEEENGAI